MKASPSDQRSILDIQRFDQQVTSLRHKASTLPELAELASTTVKSNNARDLRIAADLSSIRGVVDMPIVKGVHIAACGDARPFVGVHGVVVEYGTGHVSFLRLPRFPNAA